MGLLSALNSAVSGLNVNQQNLDTLSQNIANANTANYSNEVVNQQADFLDGQAAGVSVASITREVNQYLEAEVQTQTTANSGATELTNYYSQIQNYLGQPGGTGTIAAQITSFFSDMQDLANTPSSSAETNVVDAASSLASSISGLANSLQGLRLQADSDISSSIGTVNSDLTTLFNTNAAINQATATNQNTSGLLDTRDATLANLAQYMDINPNYSGDGEVSVSTTAGVNLVTTSTYAQLSYTPQGSIAALTANENMSPITVTTYSANGVAEAGGTITLATGGPSANVTTTLTGGQISTLLSVRDSVIPNILSQLDQLSNSIVTQVNAISNTGTSYPPPNSYTGTTLLSGNSTSTYTGNVLISPLTSSGQPIASDYADETNGAQSLDLNLGSLNYGKGAGVLSVDNIISAINQYFTPQNKVELGNINDAQLQLASNTVPSSTNSLNFNFNLNNISGSNASFFVGGVTVATSGGMVLASNAMGNLTSTQPSIPISNIATDGTGDGQVMLTTSASSNVQTGETIYLNAPSGSIGGVSGQTFGGYYTVTSVLGNNFTVTIPGTSATTAASVAVSTTALTQYATAPSGTSDTSTQSNGVISANIGSLNWPSSSSSPYLTVTATIGTVDSAGNFVTSQVTYQVQNDNGNTMNNLIGATTANGSGTLVTPDTTQPAVVAELVDANGNQLPETDGSYGLQQGYLKLVAGNSQNAVGFNDLNSNQTGYTGNYGTLSTNTGFGQYFGLNNFFVPNTPLTPTNTVTNSAVNMAVLSRLIANPGLITTGQLALGTQPSSGSGSGSAAPNYTYQITSGDNTTTQTLAGLATATENFSATGGLPAASTTFSGYAGDIIANTSTNASNATNAQTNTQALLSGFTQSAQSVSGVNLDQELANTVIYQNAYSASARVISVVDEMFSDLINSIPTQ